MSGESQGRSGRPQQKRSVTTAVRQNLIERADLGGREVSTATVMFHDAVARVRGLSATDEKALDVLLRKGPMTHAELAAETGLARPSVTDLIDRLERRRYLKRTRDPSDGRRVIVSVDSERVLGDMEPLFAGFAARLHTLYERYSDDELRAIADFLTRAAVEQNAVVGELKRQHGV